MSKDYDLPDSTIVPTVLTDTPDHYKQYMVVYNQFTKRVQIDIADGEFTPVKTININQIWWPAGWKADLHMMVAHPSAYLETLIRLKPNLVIFHAEVKENLIPLFDKLKTAGIKSGLALVKSTFPGSVKPTLEAAEHILIFNGNMSDLGQHSTNADLMQTEKVKIVKEINPIAEIGWDGGINASNILTIRRSGVSILNVGSAIAGAPDPKKAYEQLVIEMSKTEVL